MTWSITVSGADEDGSEEAAAAAAARNFVDSLTSAGVALTQAIVYLGTEGTREDLLRPDLPAEALTTGPGPVATEPIPEAAPAVDPATQNAIDAGAPVPPLPVLEG